MPSQVIVAEVSAVCLLLWRAGSQAARWTALRVHCPDRRECARNDVLFGTRMYGSMRIIFIQSGKSMAPDASYASHSYLQRPRQASFRNVTALVTRSMPSSKTLISARAVSVLSSSSSFPSSIACLKRALASLKGCKKLPATSLSFHRSWISSVLCRCFAQRRR